MHSLPPCVHLVLARSLILHWRSGFSTDFPRCLARTRDEHVSSLVNPKASLSVHSSIGVPTAWMLFPDSSPAAIRTLRLALLPLRPLVASVAYNHRTWRSPHSAYLRATAPLKLTAGEKAHHKFLECWGKLMYCDNARTQGASANYIQATKSTSK
ncbi:hypothetical protein BOTBODRAFT_266070 [Botryobasidium botryosum FD-172 SS1]|uniref:Uncharacterized protein n=1 Tax=Botryobasidium botryosum (strain FD-172 SS1) TaxID=930990 RepID=A0A067MMR8_BOTB1|nr:hypothetical protein BOTBODRAFT_266070 [Botryobasidium botryosum FD-172 SS1]